MRRLALASAAVISLVGLSQSGSAADMAARPAYKALPPPAVWSWTGFYVGLNAGGSIGRNPTNIAGNPAAFGAAGVPQSYNLSPAGFVGGGQIGYNWQFSPNWVAGIEADFQGTTQKDSTCLVLCYTQGLSTTQKLDWFGTVRGRLGYATGDWLWYVTGGGAWANIKQDFAENLTPGGVVGSVSSSHTNFGWVGGGGVETHLFGGWSAKAEYLYMDLGSIRDSFAVTAPQGAAGPFSTHSEFRDHIVRVGLNYKFGPNGAANAYAADLGTAPIYKAPPAAVVAARNWTGVYIGLNAGGSISRNPTNLTETLVGGGPTLLFESYNMSPAGFVGGGQIGYNWQFSPNWVAGFEGDFQGTTQKDSSCLLQCNQTSTFITTQKIDWFGTVRGRLGYATGNWLWYATGGAAWANVKQDFTFISVPTGFVIGSASSSQTKGGWVVGGGAETQLGGGWSAKAEYLYMDLGSIKDSFAIPTVFATESDIRDHIIRAGLNYRF